MPTAYFPLLLTVISCFAKKRELSIFMLFISVVAAFMYKIIDLSGLLATGGFYALTYVYFRKNISSNVIKGILLFFIFAFMALFGLHMIPGFNNILAIDRVSFSPVSIPFSMYLNFDKTIVALIVFINSGLFNAEKKLNTQSLVVAFKALAICSMVIISIAFFSGYIRFDYKIPSNLLLWAVNNLFFVCFAEEVIFRGMIQGKLAQLTRNKYAALTLASLLFGLAHFKGGVAYIFLATISGAFYGFVYQKTGRISSAMLVHFGLNLMHILFFTYPAAIR